MPRRVALARETRRAGKAPPRGTRRRRRRRRHPRTDAPVVGRPESSPFAVLGKLLSRSLSFARVDDASSRTIAATASADIPRVSRISSHRPTGVAAEPPARSAAEAKTEDVRRVRRRSFSFSSSSFSSLKTRASSTSTRTVLRHFLACPAPQCASHRRGSNAGAPDETHDAHRHVIAYGGPRTKRLAKAIGGFAFPSSSPPPPPPPRLRRGSSTKAAAKALTKGRQTFFLRDEGGVRSFGQARAARRRRRRRLLLRLGGASGRRRSFSRRFLCLWRGPRGGLFRTLRRHSPPSRLLLRRRTPAHHLVLAPEREPLRLAVVVGHAVREGGFVERRDRASKNASLPLQNTATRSPAPVPPHRQRRAEVPRRAALATIRSVSAKPSGSGRNGSSAAASDSRVASPRNSGRAATPRTASPAAAARKSRPRRLGSVGDRLTWKRSALMEARVCVFKISRRAFGPAARSAPRGRTCLVVSARDRPRPVGCRRDHADSAARVGPVHQRQERGDHRAVDRVLRAAARRARGASPSISSKKTMEGARLPTGKARAGTAPPPMYLPSASAPREEGNRCGPRAASATSARTAAVFPCPVVRAAARLALARRRVSRMPPGTSKAAARAPSTRESHATCGEGLETPANVSARTRTNRPR